jgi:hypothetical protein
VLQGLAVLPGPEQALRAFPMIVAALCAFLLPASQDIVARLTQAPRQAIAAALALAAIATLVVLGDRDSYDFVYFQF